MKNYEWNIGIWSTTTTSYVRGYRQPGYRAIYTGKAEAKILLMLQFLLLELNSGGAIMMPFIYSVYDGVL